MNGSRAANAALLSDLLRAFPEASSEVDVAVCVPFPYLAQVGTAVQGSSLALGAQDVSAFEKGAYTGDVSAAMLADLSCRYVIVGHSERRSYFGDTDTGVATKFMRAVNAGLCPILCVGETLDERERGVTGDVVTRQLDAVLAVASVADMGRAVVAYEPVWAIGTGKTATPEQAQDVHALIRDRLRHAVAALAEEVRIVYGGSMKPGNARDLMGQPDIDGGLIGGASLVADEFLAIVAAAV